MLLIKYLWIVLYTTILLVVSDIRGNDDLQINQRHLGCYKMFDGDLQRIQNLSVSSCLEYCRLNNTTTFAALKNGSECYCGNNFTWSSNGNTCHIRCRDLHTQDCGGNDAYSVYSVCPIGYYGHQCSNHCFKCLYYVPCLRDSGVCLVGKCRRNTLDKECNINRLLVDVNVARDRPAHQSSNYKEIYPAYLAVDGSTNSNFDTGPVCTHTNNDSLSWFSVDLGDERIIRSINIISRNNHYRQRSRGAKIYLSLHFPSERLPLVKELCGKLNNVDDISAEVKCSNNKSGRYVIVTLENNYLTICEIEVYAEDVTCRDNELVTYDNLNGRSSSRCVCQVGYTRESITSPCEDIDECIEKNNCDTNADCSNTRGSYKCSCKSGYKGSGEWDGCNDIDECQSTPCDAIRSTCINTIGSFKCECKKEFEQTDVANSCQDKNECFDYSLYNVSTTNCENTEGSYKLICKIGFNESQRQYNNIRLLCEDIDECTAFNGLDSSVTCENSFGSYILSCREGSSLVVSDGKTICQAGSNAKTIAGVIFAFIVLLILVLLFFFFKKKRKQATNNAKELELTEQRKPLTTTQPIVESLPHVVQTNTYINVDVPQSKTRIKIEELSAYIRKVMELDISGFESEFKDIPKVTDATTAYGESLVLKPKNRFQNIFPYDFTRVILSPTDEKFSDYINASHIEGYEESVNFIAAQGPSDQTVNDFWRMIIEQDVNVIVMLTQLIENNKKKCLLYWPEDNTVKFGDVTVTISSVTTWNKFIKRVLSIQVKNIKRQITQWHYIGWPDHGIPTDVQSFLRFRNNVRRSTTADRKALVHCSAGVGRTGCFIAIDILLDEGKKEGSVDVVNCITKLRQQRPYMVQTIIQYDFIYIALKNNFLERDAFISLDNYHNCYLEVTRKNSDGQSIIAQEFDEIVKEVSSCGGVKVSPVVTTSSSDWTKAFFADGFDVSNKYIIGCFPSGSEVKEFWKFCLKRNCLVIAIDCLKELKLPFAPSHNKSFMFETMCVNLVESIPFEAGKIETVSVVINISVDDNIYENKECYSSASNCMKQDVTIIHSNPETKDYLSRDFFVAVKNEMERCWINSKAIPLTTIVLSRDENTLASFYIVCCNLFDQMATHKEVNIYKAVLDMKQFTIGANLTLFQYKKLYQLIDKEVIQKNPLQLV